MENNARFETEVLSLLNQLKLDKERLQQQFDQETKVISEKIEAVSTTARLLRQAGVPRLIGIRPVSLPDLSGKTIKGACIEIAKANDGVVRVKEAKDALIAARVVRKSKHSWGVVNTTLIRSKEFEKHSEPGAYRLIEAGGQGKLSESQSDSEVPRSAKGW